MRALDMFEKEIKKATRNISEREPLTHDFFVHVESPKEVKSTPVGDYKRYLQAIKERIKHSINPVHVDNHPVNSYWDKEISKLFDRERELVTAYMTTWDIRYGPITGMIHPDYLERLLNVLKGINENDTFIIHGAAYGRCPEMFAVQLYLLIYKKNFFLPIPAKDISQIGIMAENGGWTSDLFNACSSEEGREWVNAMLEVREKLEIKKSNIRYGVIFDTEHISKSKKFGPVTKQLMSKETIIFP